MTGATAVLTKLESEAKRVAKVSEDFQQSLGAGRQKFLDLQKAYFAAKDDKAREAVMAQVPAVIHYLRSTKTCWQSAGPVFSAECEDINRDRASHPCLVRTLRCLPYGPYCLVVQSVTL